MYKLDTLKAEIRKQAGIDKEILPAVQEAKRQLVVLTEKHAFYQKQAKDLESQIENLGKEIRDRLAAGNEAEADKAIRKRGDLREKVAVFNSLAAEMEETATQEAQARLVDAEKRLFDAIQVAVSVRHNTVQAELNERLVEIEADLTTWSNAVSDIHYDLTPTSMMLSAGQIVLRNFGVRRALGI